MSKKVVELQIPINRVEGDLDIKVKIEDGVIVDAKSIGTLYRGFENILKDRDPLDSLVITPRVCGICSISHLSAAVKALEDAYGITPPMQAKRLRNISVICENLQSDIKQVFLMFMSDFASDYYNDRDFFEVAKKYYEPILDNLTQYVGELNLWSYSRVDTINKKLLKKIKSSGFNWIGMGIESGN